MEVRHQYALRGAVTDSRAVRCPSSLSVRESGCQDEIIRLPHSGRYWHAGQKPWRAASAHGSMRSCLMGRRRRCNWLRGNLPAAFGTDAARVGGQVIAAEAVARANLTAAVPPPEHDRWRRDGQKNEPERHAESSAGEAVSFAVHVTHDVQIT